MSSITAAPNKRLRAMAKNFKLFQTKTIYLSGKNSIIFLSPRQPDYFSFNHINQNQHRQVAEAICRLKNSNGKLPEVICKFKLAGANCRKMYA